MFSPSSAADIAQFEAQLQDVLPPDYREFLLCVITSRWHPQWVPFAADSCGNMICIDGAPGRNGHKYQLIYMEVQDGQGPFIADDDSFIDFLASHLQYLHNGQYEVYEWGLEIDRLLPVRRPPQAG